MSLLLIASLMIGRFRVQVAYVSGRTHPVWTRIIFCTVKCSKLFARQVHDAYIMRYLIEQQSSRRDLNMLWLAFGG
jgi:hypothetical protein